MPCKEGSNFFSRNCAFAFYRPLHCKSLFELLLSHDSRGTYLMTTKSPREAGARNAHHMKLRASTPHRAPNKTNLPSEPQALNPKF